MEETFVTQSEGMPFLSVDMFFRNGLIMTVCPPCHIRLVWLTLECNPSNNVLIYANHLVTFLLTAGGNTNGSSKAGIDLGTSTDAREHAMSDSTDISGSSIPDIQATESRETPSECRTNENDAIIEQGTRDVSAEPLSEARPIAGSESSVDDKEVEQVLGMEVGQERSDDVDIKADGAVDVDDGKEEADGDHLPDVDDRCEDSALIREVTDNIAGDQLRAVPY